MKIETRGLAETHKNVMKRGNILERLRLLGGKQLKFNFLQILDRDQELHLTRE